MKTAISLPDELFQAAEIQAERLGKSRSELYADALAEYLLRHAPDEVTEAMNRVIAEVGQGVQDRWQEAAVRRTLESIEW